MKKSRPFRIDYALLTVNAEETRFARKIFGLENEHDENGLSYDWGYIKSSDNRDICVAHVSFKDTQGEIRAYEYATKVIDILNPRFIFMIGIAGGIQKKEKIEEGDIFISQLVKYGPVKGGSYIREIPLMQPDSDISEFASTIGERLSCADALKQLINEEKKQDKEAEVVPIFKNTPKIFYNELISTDTLVKDLKSNPDWQTVMDKHPRAVAVDMEAGGIAKCLHTKAAEGKITGYLVIKGISDIADRDPSLISAGDLKDPRALATTLTDSSNAVSKFLMGKMSNATQQVIMNYKHLDSNPSCLTIALVKEFNNIIKDQLLYVESIFSQVKLREETKELLRSNHQGTDLWRLNRLLLEDAYPHGITNLTQDDKRDLWRPFASLISALFARHLIENYKPTFSLPTPIGRFLYGTQSKINIDCSGVLYDIHPEIYSEIAASNLERFIDDDQLLDNHFFTVCAFDPKSWWDLACRRYLAAEDKKAADVSVLSEWSIDNFHHLKVFKKYANRGKRILLLDDFGKWTQKTNLRKHHWEFFSSIVKDIPLYCIDRKTINKLSHFKNNFMTDYVVIGNQILLDYYDESSILVLSHLRDKDLRDYFLYLTKLLHDSPKYFKTYDQLEDEANAAFKRRINRKTNQL